MRRTQISQWLFPVDAGTNRSLWVEDQEENKMVIMEAMSAEWFTKTSCAITELWEISLCLKATSLATPRNIEKLSGENFLPYPKGQLLFLGLAVWVGKLPFSLRIYSPSLCTQLYVWGSCPVYTGPLDSLVLSLLVGFGEYTISLEGLKA